ncbi:MAG: hypothetical protein COW08_07440 [Ignavibacteriales bacterium CG12_big_fil_rev_8_21_14_0_65_30_8]|nr:MAG: hypothetical protein COW08_07440 [Ignavibacteriales bacterium CG12_big_fil_rev_8_21_14_0_65_30_8]
MKKIILITFLAVGFIYSQSNNLLQLEQQIKDNTKESVKINPLQQVLTFHKKSTGLAVLYSLLLPGMGELYADSYSSGKFFTITDGVLWGVYIGINSSANFKKDKYQTFAVTNGGVINTNQSDTYYSIIGNYINIDDYNNQKALERDFNAMFDKNKFYWNWQNNDTRKQYRDMWSSSENSFNDLKFIAGALIINRLASVINAVRLVSAYNKRQDKELTWNFSLGVKRSITLPTTLSLNFKTNL